MVILKSLQFWKGVALVLAALGFAYVQNWQFGDASILAFVIAFLKMFDIAPELRARGLL